MSQPDDSEFSLFLSHSKHSLLDLDKSSTQSVHVVMGNEACDLDSAVSALVYAFFLYKRNKNPLVLYVPVLNIPSKEYKLRTEVTFALEQLRITANQLTFRDQIDFENLLKRHKLKITLVDHNVLTGSNIEFESAVCEIIDHHKREGEYSSKVSCTIEPVGSCCTLITEIILQDNYLNVPEDVYWLLYCTILVDTICLSEAAGKATQKDIHYVNTLESKLGNVNQKEVFEKIQAAKMDVSGLTTSEILCKDLKTVNSGNILVAVSSVPLSIQELLSKDDFVAIIREFSTQQRAAVVIIMALYLDGQGEPLRELAIYSDDRSLVDQVSSHLKKPEPNLSLVPIVPPVSADPNLVVFSQLNIKASRKLVLPLLKDWLESLSGNL